MRSLPGTGRSADRARARQEIYGYVLTHHAISVLICQAATEADIDPDRVKFTRTVRRATGPAAFPPDHQAGLRAAIMVSISAKRHLNRPATGPARGSSSEPATTPTASRE